MSFNRVSFLGLTLHDIMVCVTLGTFNITKEAHVHQNQSFVIDWLSLLTVHHNSKVRKGNGNKLSHSHYTNSWLYIDHHTLYVTAYIQYIHACGHAHRQLYYSHIIDTTERYSVVHVVEQLHWRSWRRLKQRQRLKLTHNILFQQKTQHTQASLFCCIFQSFLFGLLKLCIRNLAVQNKRMVALESALNQLWAGNQKVDVLFRLGAFSQSDTIPACIF